MDQKDISTDNYEAANKKPKRYTPAACGFDQCHFDNEGLDRNEIKLLIRKELDNWDKNHETKSGLWVKLGMTLIPIIITFFIFMSQLNTRVYLLENQNKINDEMKLDIRAIRDEVREIREKIIVLENRSN